MLELEVLRSGRPGEESGPGSPKKKTAAVQPETENKYHEIGLYQIQCHVSNGKCYVVCSSQQFQKACLLRLCQSCGFSKRKIFLKVKILQVLNGNTLITRM